jgi:hypothetical protein
MVLMAGAGCSGAPLHAAAVAALAALAALAVLAALPACLPLCCHAVQPLVQVV